MEIDLEFVYIDNGIYSVCEVCVLVVLELDENMEVVENCVKLLVLSLGCRFLRCIENNNVFFGVFIFLKFE